VFDKVEASFVFLSKVALILMMLVTSIDSLGRYLLSKPLVGAYEFTEMYLMIIVVFLSISFVMKNGGHIYLDIVIYRLSKKAQNYLNVFFYILATLFILVVGYQGLMATLSAWNNNHIGTGVVAWPYWLSYIWIPVGSLLLAIRLILMSIELINESKSNPVSEESL